MEFSIRVTTHGSRWYVEKISKYSFLFSIACSDICTFFKFLSLIRKLHHRLSSNQFFLSVVAFAYSRRWFDQPIVRSYLLKSAGLGVFSQTAQKRQRRFFVHTQKERTLPWWSFVPKSQHSKRYKRRTRYHRLAALSWEAVISKAKNLYAFLG